MTTQTYIANTTLINEEILVDRALNSMTTNIINNTAIAEATVISNQAYASMSKNTITY